ncbi:SGNH/GDSL hydrolase family protein [Variovorax robiniae]|uniref:SGNH/GDSL hydrolase family protein n=1 Tax=Variovorax robiniae TaxID=1836199 RepID=A0ABU8X8L4_9BURK
MRKAWRDLALAVALGLACVVAVVAVWGDGMADGTAASHAAMAPAGSMPIAVIGDSNSHSYQDSITFPPGSEERGGALRSHTFQWIEVIARLRQAQLDPGPWVTWGRPGDVAWLRELMGLSAGRAPRKEDYLYNFANSGATCKHVMGERLGQRFRQAPRLVALMDAHPERWRNGVVVIRIGDNDWAGVRDIQRRDPASPELQKVTDYCAGQVEAAIHLIHSRHPTTRIMVVGVIGLAIDPSPLRPQPSARETANLQAATDRFNRALRAVASGPYLAFFDDAAWFDERWGSLDALHKPTAVNIGTVLRVTNTIGDEPDHAQLADNHAGLAWNAIWAQSLVAHLKSEFDLPLTPIGDDELARFVASQLVPVRAPGS